MWYISVILYSNIYITSIPTKRFLKLWFMAQKSFHWHRETRPTLFSPECVPAWARVGLLRCLSASSSVALVVPQPEPPVGWSGPPLVSLLFLWSDVSSQAFAFNSIISSRKRVFPLPFCRVSAWWPGRNLSLHWEAQVCAWYTGVNILITFI